MLLRGRPANDPCALESLLQKMKIHSTNPVMAKDCLEANRWSNWQMVLAKIPALALFLILPLAGCATPTRLSPEDMTPYGSVKLTEGDTISITFPGSPNLNTTQKVRRDGMIDLQVVGELTAVGKTPAELEKEILELYKSQILLKEVSVSLQSSSYPVFVTGSVVHAGKVSADRPMSALEAIMEAGGFDPAKANMKRVVVLRIHEGQLKHYILNLKRVLDGKSKQLFYLRPSDIVFVPEKAL